MSPSYRPIIAALRTGTRSTSGSGQQERAQVLPFVTISRLAGAGGRTLAVRLADRLNERGDIEPPWRSFDRELIEKIVEEHHVSGSLVEYLEEESQSWLKDMVSGMKFSDSGSDSSSVYSKVVETILALAKLGHTIIVGRGGVFVTREMVGALHVSIVAPLEYRIQNMMKLKDLSETEARKHVKQVDHNRQDFYQRYWPDLEHGPETFHITLNSAVLSDDQMADALLPLIPSGTVPV